MKEFKDTVTERDVAENQVVFRQMEYNMHGCAYGILFVGAGALFAGVAIAAICNAYYTGIIPGMVGMLMIHFGFPLVVCCITHLKITHEEVCLTLGPFVLQRMETAAVRTLAYSTMTPNIRGEPWTADIIVLSSYPSTHMRYIARRWVKEEEISDIIDAEEKEKTIMQKVVERYIRSNTSGFHLAKDIGIWLEYTPDRAEKLRVLFPNAEDFVS